jgi:glycerol-3-phosphate dehydrogenase (NAD(P)+)
LPPRRKRALSARRCCPLALRYEADLDAALSHARLTTRYASSRRRSPVCARYAGNMRELGIVPAHIVWLCKGFEADTQCCRIEVVAAELPVSSSNGTFRARVSRVKSGRACRSR